MNRLKQYLGEADEPQDSGSESYWVIETEGYYFIITYAEAERLGRLVNRWWGPRWLTFTDSWGARRRILRRDVNHLCESTPDIWAAARAHQRARKLEDKADRRAWEED